MKKPIIGVLAPKKVDKFDPFNNYIKFVSNYSKRIKEAGGVPIGLLFEDDKFMIEQADLCDGFVIQGGPDVSSTGINLVKYSIDTKKPLLGICLGMQTFAGYEWIMTKLDNPSYEDIDRFYKQEYENEFLEYTSGHDFDPEYIESISKSKHEVFVDKDSNLYEIFKSDVINMPSLHKQIIRNNLVLNNFKVVGKTADIIEAIEYKGDNFIVGVQFHPEIEEKNLDLFKALIEKANV